MTLKFTELQKRKLAYAMLKESFYGEVMAIYETEDNGNERLTDEARDLYKNYYGIVEKILAENDTSEEMRNAL